MRGLAAAAAAAALLLAACGSSDPRGEGLTDEQIEALSLEKAKGDPASGRPDLLGLEPLVPADYADPALRGGCVLAVGNQPVLVTGPWAAVAKRNGRVRTLQVNGPISSAGAFFETEAMSISIGQPRERAAGPGPTPGIARARINDRRTGDSIEVEGSWRCGAAPG